VVQGAQPMAEYGVVPSQAPLTGQFSGGGQQLQAAGQAPATGEVTPSFRSRGELATQPIDVGSNLG
jgi:hypothetical protein